MRTTLLRSLWRTPRMAAVKLIEFYQATLSPDHGPLRHAYPYGYCRHFPTCSEYGKEMILKRGLVLGGLLTIGRLLTCHPWRKPSEERVKQALGI